MGWSYIVGTICFDCFCSYWQELSFYYTDYYAFHLDKSWSIDEYGGSFQASCPMTAAPFGSCLFEASSHSVVSGVKVTKEPCFFSHHRFRCPALYHQSGNPCLKGEVTAPGLSAQLTHR